jgi:hypothetical protein
MRQSELENGDRNFPISARVVDHETGRSKKKVQQKLGCTEPNREDTQRNRKGVKTYGEVAQPRSHLLKERLISAKFIGECLVLSP